MLILQPTGSSQRRHAALLDSLSDDDSSESSTSTLQSDRLTTSAHEEVQVRKDTLLDQAVDALFEKR